MHHTANYNYLIFDMDGVLINTEPLHFEAWKRAFQTAGIDLVYDCYKGCIGSTSTYLLNLVENYYHVDLKENFSEIGMEFKRYKYEILRESGVPRIEGAAEAIKSLHSQGFQLAVASSSPLSDIEYELTEIGILNCFSVICSKADVTNPKPAPDIFEKAIVKLHADKEKTVVIEDSRNGSIAAKAAGTVCFGFVNPDSGEQDLSKADWTFHNYKELLDRLC